MPSTLEEVKAHIAALQQAILDMEKPAVGPVLAEPQTVSIPPYYEWMTTRAGFEPIVHDPERAHSQPCVLIELGEGRPELVFQAGIEGPLDEAARALYCAQGYERETPAPAEQVRLFNLYESAVSCGARIQPDAPDAGWQYHSCIGQELLSRGL